MPAPNNAIPSFLEPSHLYRHLLREASYLPPAWRSHITSTIRSRWHRHPVASPKKTKMRRAKAYNTLCAMRAANSGDRETMEKLVLKAFGRKGPRRRELFSDVVHFEGPTNSQALQALLDGKSTEQASKSGTAQAQVENENGKRPVFYKKWDTERLKQLLHSQKSAYSKIWLTSPPKNDENQFVPEKTIWGKPPCQSLVETKRAKWWRAAADKTMPPLRGGEWHLLQDLSNGAQELDDWKIPERRTPAQALSGKTTQDDWDWKQYASNPMNIAEKSRAFHATRRTGQQDPGPYAPRVETKELSARWYRRLYNRVGQMSPLMSQDPQTLKTSFRWGPTKSRLAPPTKAQLEIFEGVDAQGKKIAQP